jgi:hypothetical protein
MSQFKKKINKKIKALEEAESLTLVTFKVNKKFYQRFQAECENDDKTVTKVLVAMMHQYLGEKENA